MVFVLLIIIFLIVTKCGFPVSLTKQNSLWLQRCIKDHPSHQKADAFKMTSDPPTALPAWVISSNHFRLLSVINSARLSPNRLSFSEVSCIVRWGHTATGAEWAWVCAEASFQFVWVCMFFPFGRPCLITFVCVFLHNWEVIKDQCILAKLFDPCTHTRQS